MAAPIRVPVTFPEILIARTEISDLDGLDYGNDDEHDESDDVPEAAGIMRSSQPEDSASMKPEVIGLSLDMYARGSIFMSSIFLGPALLELASEAAQNACVDSASCDDPRIYGFRPSSLLSNMAMFSGLLASAFLPFFGALVDHTTFRKELGQYTAYGLVVIKGTEVFVGSSTWLLVACLQVCTALLYQPHIAATYAYTSELPDVSSKHNIQSVDNEPHARHSHTHYNTRYAMIQQVSFLQFCIFVLGVGAFCHADTLGTAKISQVLTTITAAPLFWIAWNYYFRPCPQLKRVPAGMTLWSCGFGSVVTTVKKITTNKNSLHAHSHHENASSIGRGISYRPLQLLLASIVVSEAGCQALVAIATTYMTVALQMDASAIGKVFLAVLVCGIMGPKVASYFATVMAGSSYRHGARAPVDPVRSAMLAQIYFCVVTTTACWTLRGPQDAPFVIIFGALWGVALGWLSPMLASAYMALVTPMQQQAEMMGLYLLASNLMAWLPPLIFTVLNEGGVDMKWGMASLNLYFFLGVCFLAGMGDYQLSVSAMKELGLEEIERAIEEVELRTDRTNFLV